MICPNCGTNIDGEAEFCPSCGTIINVVSDKGTKKSKKKLIIAVVAIVAVISIIVALVMPYMTKHKYDGKYYYTYQEFIGDDINNFSERNSRENWVLTEKIDKSRYIEIKGDKLTLCDGKNKREYTDLKFEKDKIIGKGHFKDDRGDYHDTIAEFHYDSKKKVIYVLDVGATYSAYKK